MYGLEKEGVGLAEAVELVMAYKLLRRSRNGDDNFVLRIQSMKEQTRHMQKKVDIVGQRCRDLSSNNQKWLMKLLLQKNRYFCYGDDDREETNNSSV